MATQDGTESIETVKVGDLVLAKDWKTGEIGPHRVTRVFSRTTETLVDLTIRDAAGNEFIISGTPEHPIFVPALGAYVPMGELKNGSALYTTDGSLAIVVSIENRQGNFRVYNMEVEDAHNYFVSSPKGGPNLLVHNTCPIDTKKIGDDRVRRVVEYFADEVIEDGVGVKVRVPGYGRTDIDVVLKGNRFIEVGGYSKGGSPDSLSDFGKQLQRLAEYARINHGEAFFYYDEGTPAQAIKLAIKWLGESHVFPIP